jgi:rare lipoprotein A
MKQRSTLLATRLKGVGLKSVGVSILTVALLGGCAETKLVANTAKMATQPDAPTTQPYKIGKPYQVDGAWYYPKADYDYDETGIASWYGPGFHGGNTANGEVYDQNALTAAHKTLPMPSLVRVTNLENGRSIVVRINDRGPFVNNRIIDMTQRGAQLLGFDMNGTAKVRVQVLKEESMILAAQASQQGGDNVPPPPKASPAGTVAATALPPTGQTTASAAAPSPAVPSAIQSKAGPGTPAATAGQTPAAASTPPVTSAALPKPQNSPATSPATTPAPAPAVTQTAALPPAKPTTATPTTAVKPAATATSTAPKPAKTTAMGPVADLPTPDGKVTVEPVKGNSSIYIQAGAFLRQNNAQQLSTKLAALGTSKVTQVKLGQQTFYRVRLGPIASVEKADELLQQVIDDGNPEARIIVE